MTNALSKAYVDHPVHLRHIIPIDFDAVQAVPESHQWLTSSENSPPQADDRSSVPLIDLSGPDASNLIVASCEARGVFQVINHGVPPELIDKVESEAKGLFGLPASQKLKALRSPAGATGYGVARIAPFFDKYMWHEGFTVMGSPLDHAKLLWPCDDRYQQFCAVMQEYEKRMEGLVSTILRMILKSLDLSQQEIDRILEGASSAAVQLNSYPRCPEPKLAMGLAPHTDTSTLTVLHQNDVEGLEVHEEGVGWEFVKPVKGALVVNVGDLLHVISNGRFPCVVHRVVIKEVQKQRVSAAYFSSLPVDLELRPLGLRSGEVAKYRRVTVLEYIGIKARSLDKALSFIRISSEDEADVERGSSSLKIIGLPTTGMLGNCGIEDEIIVMLNKRTPEQLQRNSAGVTGGTNNSGQFS